MKKTAVILCGGKGSRLGLLGKKYNKSLIKVQNREILWYIIKILQKHGFNNFILPLGYKSRQIKRFLIRNKNFNTNIDVVNTGANTSIGKRIALVLNKIKSENFILLNGDAIFEFDVNRIIQEHMKRKVAVTFMVTEITYQYGTVGIVNGKVVDFKRDVVYEALKLRNKSKYNAFNYSGISIINTKLLRKMKSQCLRAKNFEMEIYPKLIKKKGALMKRIKGFWHSIDNVKDINIINNDKSRASKIKKIRLQNK